MSTDTADAIDPAGVADLESLYERMLRIRLLEDAVHRLFLNNEVEGTTHLYQGQEAVAVGVCDVLQPGDTVAATYRGHGACLAMGVDQTAMLAEFLGRETGTNGGRGGSMNVIDLERGIIGCFGIVGGSIAAATGAALASQLKKDGSVAVAFFGDGAVEPGLLPRVPQLRRACGSSRSSTSARTTSTASGARMLAVTGGRGDRRPRGRLRDAGRSRSTGTTSSRFASPRATRSRAPARATARRCSRPRPTATRGIPASTRASTDRRRRSRSGSAATRIPRLGRPPRRRRRSRGSRSSIEQRARGRAHSRARVPALPSAEAPAERLQGSEARHGARSASATRSATASPRRWSATRASS